MVNDIRVPTSCEIQWQIDQNDGITVNQFNVEVRSYINSYYCHQTYIKMVLFNLLIYLIDYYNLGLSNVYGK